MPEAPALARALDQPGDVGHDEPLGVVAGDAEVRRERGERVVRDLGLGGGEPREQRGLARVRQPDESDVGDGAELEPEALVLAVLSRLGRPLHAVAGTGEARRCLVRPDRRGRRPPARLRPRGRRRDPARRTTTVPSGTGSTHVGGRRRRPRRPCVRGRRGPPSGGGGRRATTGRAPRVETSKTTDPPSPPSPPSGPPRGLNGSECSDAEPSPPRPGPGEHGALVDERHRRQPRWSPAAGRAMMRRVLEPVTVWMVQLRRRSDAVTEVKGTLALGEDEIGSSRGRTASEITIAAHRDLLGSAPAGRRS